MSSTKMFKLITKISNVYLWEFITWNDEKREFQANYTLKNKLILVGYIMIGGLIVLDLTNNYKRTVTSDMYDQVYYVNIYISYLMQLIVSCDHYVKQDKQVMVYNLLNEADNCLKIGLGVKTLFPKIYYYLYFTVCYVLIPILEIIAVKLYFLNEGATKLLLGVTICVCVISGFLVSSLFQFCQMAYRYKLLNEILANATDREDTCCYCTQENVQRAQGYVCPLHLIKVLNHYVCIINKCYTVMNDVVFNGYGCYIFYGYMGTILVIVWILYNIFDPKDSMIYEECFCVFAIFVTEIPLAVTATFTCTIIIEHIRNVPRNYHRVYNTIKDKNLVKCDVLCFSTLFAKKVTFMVGYIFQLAAPTFVTVAGSCIIYASYVTGQ